ncbi:MAG: hypothetical protein ACLGI2_10450 [Acidimicrobiia bacterium]
MNRKIRKLVAGPLLAASLAGGVLVAAAGPADALYVRNTAGTCVEGSTKTDQWGNVYKCVGGKWVLYSMPALTMRAVG